MIDMIDTAIAARVTTCLSWLERWGGLVIPVEKKVQVGDGWATRIFPVACGLDPACDDDSKFQKILPNDAYKSVGYLYQIGQATTTFTGPRENFLTATYRLRLVVWLNYNKIGLDDCKYAAQFEADTIANFRADIELSSDLLGQVGRLHMRRFTILPKEPASVFSPFYVADTGRMYFWPYGFFAIEFDAIASINVACLTAPSIGNETECLTAW